MGDAVVVSAKCALVMIAVVLGDMCWKTSQGPAASRCAPLLPWVHCRCR